MLWIRKVIVVFFGGGCPFGHFSSLTRVSSLVIRSSGEDCDSLLVYGYAGGNGIDGVYLRIFILAGLHQVLTVERFGA